MNAKNVFVILAVLLTALSNSFGQLPGQSPGQLKWSAAMPGRIDASPAIGPDGTIYITSPDSILQNEYLYAVNPNNGVPNWDFDEQLIGEPGTVTSPKIGADGTIYVTSGDGHLYAIKSDGSMKWGSPPYVGGVGDTAPAVAADGTIYVTIDDYNNDNDNGLIAINPDGTPKWNIHLTSVNEIVSSPTVGPDGTVYFMTVGGKLYAYTDAVTQGQLKWSLPIPTAEEVDAPPSVGADGTIYVGGIDGYLYAIDPDGLQKWRFNTGWPIYSSPSIAPNGNVYIGNEGGQLFVVNPDGSGHMIFTAGGAIESTPAISADGTIIYFGSVDGNLYAIQPNGSLEWQYTTGRCIRSSPAIGPDGTVYIGSEDGNLYAVYTLPFLYDGRMGDNTFSFNISGDKNTSWTVYSSTDLKNWTPVGTVTLNGSGSSSYNDVNVNGVGYRFYKLSNGAYCSRAIGFERTTVEPGTETWIANQLDAPLNTLDGLLNFGPNSGIQIQKWNGAGYDIYTWNGSQWSPNGNATLLPGEGAKIITPTTASPVTVTFVGLVREGHLTIPLPNGSTDFVSSMVPQAGGIQSVLGYNPSFGNEVFLWRNNEWETYFYDPESPTMWDDGGGNFGAPEPVLNVGEAVLIIPGANETWTRIFSACAGGNVPALSSGKISGGPGGRFIFHISGDANTSWTVYSSTDLENWTPIRTVTLTTGLSSFTDSPVNGVPYRFYKLSNGTYSSRAIGFERLTVSPGCTAIANPLAAPVNTLNGLFKPMPDLTYQYLPNNTVIQLWNQTGQWINYTWISEIIGPVVSGHWSPNGDAMLFPGTGARIQNNSSSSFTVTFVGLVLEGQLTIPLVNGNNYVSSMVPQAGGIQSVLGFNPSFGDEVQLWRNNEWEYYMYDPYALDGVSPSNWCDGGGNPVAAEPVLNVGEVVWITPSYNETWTRNFSVCSGQINHPPVANSKTITVIKTFPSNLTLTGSDPDGDALTFAVATSPAHGTLTGTSPHLTYSPNVDYAGADSFTFMANDGKVNSSPATVSINVIDPNQPTVTANNDLFPAVQNTANQLDVLANDTDSSGYPLAITSKTDGSHGTVSIAGDGLSLLYTPSGGFYGVDSFTYTIDDGHGLTATATVTVFVNKSGNSAPTAVDDSATLLVGTYTATINLLANDTDPNSDSLTIYSIDTPTMGTVANNGGGQITYTRDPSKFGTDSFNYVVTDGNGGYATATVTISQVDSDGDGMPDEWENAHGLNPNVDDSRNDPDGDGLPNLAEYQLHTDPQIPDNPLNLSVVSLPDLLSGTVIIPLQISPDVDNNAALTLYVDDVKANAIIHKVNGLWIAEWDTMTIQNGTHKIFLGFFFDMNSNPDGSKVFGNSKTVTVANVITVDEVARWFTDQLTVDVNVNIAASGYTIEVYDVATGNHLKSLSGTVSSGKIETGWDLNDIQGNRIANGPLRCDFYLTTSASASQQNVSASPLNVLSGTPSTFLVYNYLHHISGQSFTVAYGFDYFFNSTLNALQTMIRQSVVENLDTLSDYYIDLGGGGDYPLLPLPNSPGGNVPYASAWQFLPNKQSIETLKAALADGSSANFYWWGHGLPNEISPQKNGPFFVSDTDVSRVCGNFLGGANTINHPYRLVILDCCDGYSQAWAGAFGIIFQPNGSPYTVNDYNNKFHLDPQAFVGWEVETPAPINADQMEVDQTCLNVLFVEWQLGFRLDICVKEYTDGLIEFSSFNRDNDSPVKLGPDGISDYKEYKISGCIDLTTFDR